MVSVVDDSDKEEAVRYCLEMIRHPRLINCYPVSLLLLSSFLLPPLVVPSATGIV